MQIGIIRCQQTEDLCSGNTCFKMVSEKKQAFEEIEKIEIIGFVSCGGCPGKKIIPRAKMMIKNGAETIFLASCISKGTPIGFVCPHFEQIKSILTKQIKDIKLIDWTH